MNFLRLVRRVGRSRVGQRVSLFSLAGFFGATLYGFAQDGPVPIFTLQDKRINELSGMTASRVNPGYFWAHNDSGDSARVFLVDGKGKTAATFGLEGIEARDWEDMSFAGGFVYIGDMGDNFSVMENIKIHRFREPKIAAKEGEQEIKIPTSQIETMTLAYPDGPRDAETLAVTHAGRILVVSKEGAGSNFYATPTPFQNGAGALKKIGGPVVFGHVGKFTKLATGGEFSPNGKKLAISTYSQLYEFALGAPFDFNSLNLKSPKIQSLPRLKQCESAAYTLDGSKILVSTEKENAPVYALDSLLGGK